MQKWEYRWVVVPHSLGKMKVGGDKVRARDHVNDLGEQGWELVAVEQGWPGAGISDYILFFKRPRA
jgi:hypothetical protein